MTQPEASVKQKSAEAKLPKEQKDKPEGFKFQDPFRTIDGANVKDFCDNHWSVPENIACVDTANVPETGYETFLEHLLWGVPEIDAPRFPNKSKDS